MMKQIKNLRSTAAIFLVMMVATAQAADNPRETPLVKAVKRAREIGQDLGLRRAFRRFSAGCVAHLRPLTVRSGCAG